MARTKLKPLDVYRQSTLASFETCARRTRFDLQAGDVTTGWTESAADLGSVVHEVLAEILRTIKEYGEPHVPTQEAVEIMYEVMNASSIVLPVEDCHTLRWLVLDFCDLTWDPSRIAAIEERLTLDVLCPDGEIRTLKGQPDVVLFDPPHGLIIPDWKSGKGTPKKPRDPSLVIAEGEMELVKGLKYLSERGHFQLDTYGLLALMGHRDDGSMIAPTASYATMREYHLRSRSIREATLTREAAMEHVVRILGHRMMQIDNAISGGAKSALWAPRSGSHCTRQCPVARSCPIPREMRGDGAISTQTQADVAARQFVVAGAQEEQTRVQLKAWEEGGNPPGRANDRDEVRWGPDRHMWKAKGGGRKFGLWPISNGNGNGGS
jgi:hypothetical protein